VDHFESSPDRPADRPFEAVRPAYAFGAESSARPEWRGHSFDEIEGELAQAWRRQAPATPEEWEAMRPYARAAFEQSRARREGATFADTNLGGSPTHQRPSFSDPLPKYAEPADSSTGQDVGGSRDVPR
jgi:hypothetical protein